MLIKREKIQRALDLLKHVDAKENFITIEVLDNKIIFASISSEAAIRFKGTPIESEDIPAFAVKRDYLSRMLKSNAEEFNITKTEKTVMTKLGGAKISSSIGGQEMIADFAEVELNKNEFHISKEIMDSMLIAKTYVNEKSTRKALTGVNLNLVGQKLTVTGTDNFKFYVNQFELPDTKETDIFNIILPLKAVDALASIFAITNGRGFNARVNNQGLFVNTKPLYFQTTIINETFPNVNQAIEKIKKEEEIIKLSLDDKQLNELKLIGTSSIWLDIRSHGSEEKPLVIFKSATAIEVNESAIKVDKYVEFEKRLNYKDFIDVIEKTGSVSIKNQTCVAENSTGTYILQLARIEKDVPELEETPKKKKK